MLSENQASGRIRRPDATGTAFGDDISRSWLRLDPVAAQKELCLALEGVGWDRRPDSGQLAALLALDSSARQICERLLTRYVEGDAQLRKFERKVCVAALRLSQSMALAFERLLPGVAAVDGDDSPARAAGILVRLFQHRHVEYLLRFFRFKRRNAEQWRGLHEAYGLAQQRNQHRLAVSIGKTEAAPGGATTLERQYIQILLLEIMNDGQFSPREALWAYGWLALWSEELSLQPRPDGYGRQAPRNGFAVDPHGGEGPMRVAALTAASGALLYLDSAPLMAAIDRTEAALREPAAPAPDSVPGMREGQLALLARLRPVFAPDRERTQRRGERLPAASTVQLIAGLPQIVQMLRDSARRQVGTAPVASSLDEPTIDAFGGPTRSPSTILGFGAADSVAGTTPEVWQLKDRSDSGCRMRGRTVDLNRVIPGSLVAMRAGDDAPWIVAVVRRLRRLMVDHVETGVEHLGRKPRYVKMFADDGDSLPVGELPRNGVRCFGALYLPPSEAFPTMPIKTLLLPAREFRPGGLMTLLTSSAVYRLRLNQPIQRQSDYVWTSFAVLERNAVAANPANKGAGSAWDRFATGVERDRTLRQG